MRWAKTIILQNPTDFKDQTLWHSTAGRSGWSYHWRECHLHLVTHSLYSGSNLPNHFATLLLTVWSKCYIHESFSWNLYTCNSLESVHEISWAQLRVAVQKDLLPTGCGFRWKVLLVFVLAFWLQLVNTIVRYFARL